MKRVLVMGAGGFIGKSVVRALSADHFVKAFDLNPVNGFENTENVETITGNFVSLERFDELIADVDAIIHLISTTVPSDDTSIVVDEIEQNIIPTVRLLESMVRCGVDRILFASSGGTVYGETGSYINTVDSPLNPICSYGVQKKVIESYIRFYGLRYGIDYSIMRMTNPYGWGQDSRKMQGLIPIFVNKIFREEPITIYGDGTNKREYIFIDDLAQGITRVLDYQGDARIFNMGYGKYYSTNEIIAAIEKHTGRKFSNISYIESRFCDVHESYIDIKSSQQELGWFPKVSLDDGLERTIAWVKMNLEQ